MKRLADLLRHFDGSCVVHVGAGLSTAAGIRDFRGKKGVWTEFLSKSQHQVINEAGSATKYHIQHATTSIKSEPSVNNDDTNLQSTTTTIKPFDETTPTIGHMALKALCELGLVKHIVSQNVDGLFLKSNLNRGFISELHGNFYLDECTKCRHRFIRGSASKTMRLTRSSIKCPRGADNINQQKQPQCKGSLRDTILDWESSIPYNELRVATRESKKAKLHICVGTSLQLRPSKDLVCKTPSKVNKLVIINLQPTKFDQKADLVINYYADDVFKQLADVLDFDIPAYDLSNDPTKDPNMIGKIWKK